MMIALVDNAAHRDRIFVFEVWIDMLNEEVIKQLRRLGYDRQNKEYYIQNDVICNKNCKDKTLNHSILSNCKMEAIIFDNASATGSIFRACKLIDCSIVQTDFEFCNFYDSYFKSHSKIIASFNNSNFINTVFEDINFEFCTFTGALFENCIFKSVKISDSTLENAIFKNCIFSNMDLCNLNMDFVEVDDPKMENVLLSLSQIPYMFGCLQYIFSTNDNVRIGSQNGPNISISEYKDNVMPLLIEFWENNKSEDAEYYFPLANVYITSGDYNNAVTNLRNGLKNAVVQHDFRIIKFYCKLISRSGLFNSSALYNFYNIIKRFGTSNGNGSLPDTRSFIRNIGEIEAALFSSHKEGKAFLRFRTNLSTEDTDRVGIILGKIFSLSKMKRSFHSNRVEMSLTENSPLMISLQINGDAENIVILVNSFLLIARLPESQAISLSIRSLCAPTDQSALMALKGEASEILTLCSQYDIKLFLVEYYMENCAEILPKDAKTYYYFNDMDANHWQENSRTSHMAFPLP